VIASTRSHPRLVTRPLIWLIAGAWALAVVAQLTGRAAMVHHHELAGGGIGPWAGLGLFVGAWQLHVAAMMLPSSLPMIGLFARVIASQPQPDRLKAAFLGGYGAVWTGFGALAFLGDLAVHRTAEQWPWLSERPWLIGGAVLVLAGAFQFSRLKDRCLKQCRNPAAYLLRHYRRGVVNAFRMGGGHGLFCVGCCWALMLVMFAAGIANLAWMVPLALVMTFEKTGSGGDRAVAPIGIGLIGLGALVLAHPPWLPAFF
jgi:predicted metal-binding membrane protein